MNWVLRSLTSRSGCPLRVVFTRDAGATSATIVPSILKSVGRSRPCSPQLDLERTSLQIAQQCAHTKITERFVGITFGRIAYGRRRNQRLQRPSACPAQIPNYAE